jgi:hypothetical protein
LTLENLEDRYLLSTNIGLTPFGWTPMGPAPIVGASDGPYTGRIAALAVSPTNPNLIFAGAASGGVWRTTNGGTTWSPGEARAGQRLRDPHRELATRSPKDRRALRCHR